MMLKVVVMYDKCIQCYQSPLTFRTEEEAIRSIKEAMKKPNSELFRYAEDYDFYQIAEYDNQLGEIKSCQIKKIVSGLALKMGIKSENDIQTKMEV